MSVLEVVHISKLGDGEVLILFGSKRNIINRVCFNVSPIGGAIDFNSDISFDFYKTIGFKSIVGYKFSISDLAELNDFLILKEDGDCYKIIFNQTTNIAILISARELIKYGVYIFPDDFLRFSSKRNFYLSVLKRPLFYCLWFFSLLRIFNIYTEYEENKADNAYKLYEYHRNKYTRFLNRFLSLRRSKYAWLYHLSHFMYIFTARKVITSWRLEDVLLQYKLLPIFRYSYVLLKFKWFYVSHGISYDKKSHYLSKYCFGQPYKTCCSSPLEKEYFESLGYDNVVVTGYPRMDKWVKNNDVDGVLVSFSWNKKILDRQSLLSSRYFFEMKNIIHALNDEQVYFFFHPAINNKMRNLIKFYLYKENENIIFLSTDNPNMFQDVFLKARVLITDTSSVAYDFSYMDKKSIFYLPDGYNMNYEFKSVFWDNHPGYVVNNVNELMRFLNDKNDISYIVERKKLFFKYMDLNNTNRVLEVINED